MTHACSHDRTHPPDSSGTRKLTATLSLVMVYFVAELIGGLWTGSLALLADAWHMFADMAALGLSLFAAWISRRSPTARQTYGYHRAEIIAAVVNGVSLAVVSGSILHEAWERFGNPAEILSGPMFWIALGGLIINLLSLKVLHGAHEHNLNVRSAWLHVMGDTLGSVGVIVASILIVQFGWVWADVVASVMVCLMILYSAISLLKESIGILMENAPDDVDADRVGEYLSRCPAVDSYHCLHIWVIASGLKSLSAHVVLDPDVAAEFELQTVRHDLSQKFGIDHVTLQVELKDGPFCDQSVGESCLIVRQDAHAAGCHH